MTNQPTFLARYLRDGSIAFQCRRLGTRYILAICGHPSRDECAAYREGQLIRTGSRLAVVNAIESDARWSLRANN